MIYTFAFYKDGILYVQREDRDLDIGELLPVTTEHPDYLEVLALYEKLKAEGKVQ